MVQQHTDVDALYREWKKAVAEKRESEWIRTLPKDLYDLVRDWGAEESDAHSCVADADEFGYCRTCGAIVPGSYADHKEHGW